jgi:hypothetical protein
VSRYHRGGHGGGRGNGGPQQPPQQGGQGGGQSYRGGHGQGRGRGNGGRGNGGGPKLTCQVCNKYGHDALRCRNRFNHAYQPEEQIRENREHAANAANIQGSGYTVETNWYMDSGVTDHLTSALDRLHLHERYSGKDHVQVANGAGLHIPHIGQSKIPGSSRSLALKDVLCVPNI